MKLECLPNEILLDTFEYLHAIHVLRAFYGLNSRLNKLLNTSFKSYYLDFRSVSKCNFNIICQQHLPSIINKIISLHLADDDETPNLPEIFLSYNFTLDRFNHLQALSLYSIQSLDLLNQILLQSHQVAYLKLIQCFYNNIVYQLIDNIWSLPKLIDCHIDGITLNGVCFSKLSTLSLSMKSLSIKNLTCDFQYLSHVFEKTPCLQQLSTTIICTDKTEKLHIDGSFLTKLNLSFRGSIPSMVNLFQEIFNLRSLTISTSYLLLNGIEWENILVDHLPNLKNFQLKMSFQFPQCNDIDNEVDAFLATFQTNFWIEKHQWFVRCDWNSSNPFNHAILYTLPYAFNDFHFTNESSSKSTLPNEEDYWLYNRVQILQLENNKLNSFLSFSIQFPNISHLDIILPFNTNFLFNIPSLNHLKSLDITLLSGDSAYDQLQFLINRAPHLHLLRFSHLFDLEMMLFKITNPSIRRLDFFTKESMLYSWYFNLKQCLALAHSSLGQQCQTLVIDVENRTNIIDLINHMTNLQSIIFQCKDDKWKCGTSGINDDEFIQWLHEHLPVTCSISRQIDRTSIIQIWIR